MGGWVGFNVVYDLVVRKGGVVAARVVLWLFTLALVVPAAAKGTVGAAVLYPLVALWLVMLLSGGGWPRGSGTQGWLLEPLRIGSWRFVLFLVILSGFWTAFNQIFMTMPEYIRDYVDTTDILQSLYGASGRLGWVSWSKVIPGVIVILALTYFLASRFRGTKKATTLWFIGVFALVAWVLCGVLANSRHFLQHAVEAGYKVNPEYIINIDAGAIIVFQVLVSFVMKRFAPFATMVVGTLVAAAGIALAGWATTGWFVVATIFIFAFGEMAASPKSQEYIGRIAPRDKVALFMGYYFVAIALGNLFGGLLSGKMYQKFAVDTHRTDLMWWLFGLIGVATAVALLLYNKYVVPGWKEEVAAQEA